MSDTIRGYPTITARDVKTGKIVWEKTYQNTASVNTKIVASHANPYPISDTIYTLIFGRDAVQNKDTYNTIYVSPFKVPKISRFASFGTNYRISASSNYSPVLDSGQTVLEKTTVETGTPRLKNVVINENDIYAEFYGQLKPMSNSDRIISTIYLIYADTEYDSVYYAYGGNTNSILAFLSLDEPIIQTPDIVVDITYKFIAPNKYGKYKENYSNRIRASSGWTSGFNKLEYKTSKVLRAGAFTNCSYSHFIDYSKLPNKYHGLPYIKHEFNHSLYDDINLYRVVYNNNDHDDTNNGYLFNSKINYNSSSFGGMYGSIKKIYSPTPCAKLHHIGYDYSDTVFYADPRYNETENISSLSRTLPAKLNVYSHKHRQDKLDRPFIDTQFYRDGYGSINVSMTENYRNYPEMYFIDVTEGGASGTAKAKITKRPYLGSVNNKFYSSSAILNHISGEIAAMGLHDSVDVDIFPTQSIFDHDYGYEYQNAADRYALSDGHILLVTRKGVLLTHISVLDYEIYDKNSDPQLPVSMISSIVHNYNTGETFIGCADTGLYKLKRNLHNKSEKAVITKISGINNVYAMYTDKRGKFALATDNGLQFSTDNCDSFTTISPSNIGLDIIASKQDMKKINSIATDFDSSDFKSMIFFSKEISVVAAFFSKDSGSTKIDDFSGGNNNLYADNISGMSNWYNFLTRKIYTGQEDRYKIKDNASATKICSVRFLDNIADVNFIKTNLHKDILSDPDYKNKQVVAFSMLIAINQLPGKLIKCKNGKFYVGISGLTFEFEFGNSSYTKVNKNQAKDSIYSGVYSGSNTYYPESNGFTYSGNNIIHTPIILDSGIFRITSSADFPYETYNTTRDESFPIRGKYYDMTGRNYGIGTHNSYAGDAVRDYDRLISFNQSVIHTAPEDVSISKEMALFKELVEWRVGGFTYIDVFEDSGLALITCTLNSPIQKQINHLSNDYLKGIPNYDDFFNELMPNDECMNSGRFQTCRTFIWNMFQPINKRYGSYAKYIDKIVQVNGQDEFILTDGKINVDGLELEINSNGSGANAFVKGDYYSFVKYDGILHDDSTSFSIQNERTLAEKSDRLNQSGRIELSQNSFTPRKAFRPIKGFYAELKDGTSFTCGPSHQAYTVNAEEVSLGDFKYSIDISKIKGVGHYWHEVLNNSRSSVGYFLLWVGEAYGKKFFFPTVSTNNISMDAATLLRNQLTDSDTLTVEFNGTTREFIVRKNGSQVYNSGAYTAKSIPLVRVFKSLLGLITDGKNIIVTEKLNDKSTTGYNPWLGPSVMPGMKFEYKNKGYYALSLGNELEKTGVYDPKFVALSAINTPKNTTVKIDGKEATKQIPISYITTRTMTNTHAEPLTPILETFQKVGENYPTGLKSGEVMIFQELGLLVFSEEDVGKKFSIDYSWYKDVFVGVDEFAEESDIPSDS